MRDARTRAGKTAADASARAGFAQGTLSKYERSENPFPVSVVYRLADYYGLTPEDRDKLCDLAGQKALGWWHVYREIPDWFASYVAFEAEAEQLQSCENTTIPGLLQTADYARALLSADVDAGTPEQIENQVEVRIQRQERLVGENPVHLSAVFDEVALHRQAGEPDVMRHQLESLLEQSQLSNVDLRVLPFDAGVHTASENSFMIMKFPNVIAGVDFVDVVYVEYKLGSLYLEDEAETSGFSRVFERLQEVALDPEQSVKLIQRIMDERYA
ncbi:helix-turn-helix domain-containing protein [Murinocardiopsis flavida]|nr:helix-turn-helix transcriptional regulator [Murinocardiopsis flavida]